ncbi:MAG: helix-turn-helix transcriptional regulator [Mediterranea sp.]|jgi:transcriptional regulator with XRE-family HTH domain|nr:helix-turn-helix transcriptional regulator [Mediterranea sp.]
MELKDRIKVIMDRESLSPRAFADAIGLQQSTLSHILNDRNKPSLDVVMKIHQRYPEVSLEWLIDGVGNMLLSGDDEDWRVPVAAGNGGYRQTSLFDENPVNQPKETVGAENRKEMATRKGENARNSPVVQEIKYIERPARKITEIRIFFDDNTYEIFGPKGEK